MTKREINFFSETLSSGNFTEFLNLFIPGLYDKGTIVTDVLDPNLRKIDTWAKTVDEQFNKICGQNIEGFIEDVGTKKENNFYLSKNKNGLYLCNGETSSTDPDDTVAFTKMDINTIYELITSLQTSNDKKLDKGTVPASLNSAEKIVAALQGNGGLKFDENLLYLNDEGTKKVGYYYLDRLADGIFECLEQTEETINNSAKFRDISNKASADRLDNLGENIVQYGDQTCIKYNNGIMIILAYSKALGTANPQSNHQLKLCQPFKDNKYFIVPIHTSSDGGFWMCMAKPISRDTIEFQTFNLSSGVVPCYIFGFYR